MIGDADALYDFFVEDPHTAGRNRAHGEFFVTGHAEFANDENVERQVERAGNFVSDRNAAARKSDSRPRRPARKLARRVRPRNRP
jgi:hypothetical protein